jgi:4-carboxymuconolactone decarboxylase
MSTTARYKAGLEKLTQIDGQAGAAVIAALSDIAPDLGKYIIEFAFGDIYCREDLSLHERELLTLASLLSLGGCENQLKVHIHAALNIGIEAKKIVEVMLHCIPYVGFPRVLNAVFTAKQIFLEQDITVVALSN